MFPRLARADAARGARLLVNLTNDGWYKDTWGPYQHFQTNVYRAIEDRVREQGVELREAVLSGAVERFRPVLMTATVATVGMLPAALAIGIGTDVQRALATVVVGGLVVATLLTLFILPTYYFALERWAEGRQASPHSTLKGEE